MDFDDDGKPDYSSPYQLRRELVTRQFDFDQPVERYKLGRALYHIAQHRGFKSSKGETLLQQETNSKQSLTDETTDIAGEMKASEEKLSKGLSTYMKENNLLTVGAAFAQLEHEGVRIRNNNDYRAIRSQFQREIETIFKFQQGLSIESELHERLVSEKENVGTIFYKRPLRSQRGNVGKCTLERTKPRCAIGHPLFEKFRAWTLINNIKVRMPETEKAEQLPMKLRFELYNDCFLAFVRAEFKFEDIRKYLEKRLGVHFSNGEKTINYKDSTSVAGCPITARFRKLLGENWESFRVDGQKQRQAHGKNNASFHTVSYTVEDIWHFCYDAEEPEAVSSFAQDTLKWEKKKAEELVRIWSAMPQGYAMLSQKAIRNINKMLILGLKYSDAVLLAKVPEIVKMSDEEILSVTEDYHRVEAQVGYEKRINNIVNALIAKYKSTPEEDCFADHNYEYILDESDEKEIVSKIENSLGARRWSLMDADEQTDILQKVRDKYQDFFRSHERKFVESPKLGDCFEEYLVKRFPMVEGEQWKKLYHPSQIAIYRPVPAGKNHSDLRLGNPDIGAIKNPTVLRVLNTLRRRVNQLLDDGVISPDETRVVVETARELNDANRKWALDTYDRIRHDENKKIKEILAEFYPKRRDTISTDDVDKARYVIDQREIDYFTESKTYNKDIKKYKFWLEQGGQCMYTGRTINLSNLFDPNAFDIEHTIPESLSFDSSDMNQTLCDAHYNRFIKKNHIPADMPNYDKAVRIDGKEYPAITSQLQLWIDRVERLNRNVEYWKGQARRAQNKDRKDQCMREMHLWKMELEYWTKKLERFTITEVTDGFKNSQLVDTRVITRHAVLYLKSIFNHVEVQRGETTAEFRKILGLQSIDEKKDRSLHSHHAIDATMLTVIPSAAKRDRMLELFYKIEETKKALKNYNENNKAGLNLELKELEEKLDKEKKDCRVGRRVNELDRFINENIIVSHHTKDQALTPAHRRLRKRGKIVGGKEHQRWQTGDSLRGEIHKASYYGAITQFAKDANGKVLMKNRQAQIDPTIYYVIRRELKYKRSTQDSGFINWEDLEKVIVDTDLFGLMKGQFPEGTSFKDACEQGFYMIKKGKNGEGDVKTHRIRHVRCKAVKTALRIKEQTYKSSKDYKQFFYAAVGDLYVMCSYTDGKKRDFKIYSLYDISNHRKSGTEDIPKFITDKKGNRLALDYELHKGDMVLVYKDSPEELYDMEQINLKRRLYMVYGFENDGLRIRMSNHLFGTDDKAESVKDYKNLPTAIRCGIKTIKFLIMGKHRDFVIRNGNIEFNH